MRQRFFFPILLFCLVFFTGCGRDKDASGESKEYYDIITGTEQIFDIEETYEHRFLGMQFYQGERVQIWAEKALSAEDGTPLKEVRGDVYLHRENGNAKLLLADIPDYYLSGSWWLDEDGRYFLLKSDGIIRLDEEGREVFFKQTGENVKDICQFADGRIMLLLAQNGNDKLGELNPDTGMINIEKNITLGFGNQYIGTDEERLLLLDSEGLWEVNPTDGGRVCDISFAGTTYMWKSGKTRIEAFRVLESGGVELLWSDGKSETLLWSKVGDDRKLVAMRGIYFNEWMKEQVVRFNQHNLDYYVVLEELSTGEEGQTFRERTDMEIAVGKGADIICSSAVNDVYSLISKGAFADLSSFMEESGMNQADYFPLAFYGRMKDEGLYGINAAAEVEGVWMDRAVIGSGEGLDVEALADRMLAYKEKAVFMEGYGAPDVLRYFLQGSENLWGMLDWEKGTCDFSGGLFAKLLEASKRYGDSEGNSYPAIAGIRSFYSFYWFDSTDALESEGKASVGYLFDDGCHEAAKTGFMAVNANSAQKQGAWEFISFLLGDEAQAAIDLKNNYTINFPVNRRIFEMLKEEALSSGTVQEGVWTISYGSITEDDADELTKVIEGAEQVPIQMEPILKFICEEAEEYFAGVKSVEEVCGIIENRVQLYLNEKNRSIYTG